MTELLTFFGERGPEMTSCCHRLELESPDGPCVLSAWTRREGDLRDRCDGGGFEHRAQVEDLRRQVRELGGGILAEVVQRSGLVRLHRVAGNGLGDVRRLLLLSPFGNDGEVPLSQEVEELRLRRGEHLLVPVSARAEERLFELRELLAEMGPDVETLVLETLRSPSLDVRVGRIEEALELDRSGRSKAPWLSRRERRRAKAALRPSSRKVADVALRRRRPLFLRLALVVLVLLLVLFVGWSLLHDRSETSSSEGPALDQLAVPPGDAGGGGESLEEPTLSDEPPAGDAATEGSGPNGSEAIDR